MTTRGGEAETDAGELMVVEVASGGNAERAGVKPGDLLRGTTAVRMQMEYPTANLMFGGMHTLNAVSLKVKIENSFIYSCIHD